MIDVPGGIGIEMSLAGRAERIVKGNLMGMDRDWSTGTSRGSRMDFDPPLPLLSLLADIVEIPLDFRVPLFHSPE